PSRPTHFPYTTLFRSERDGVEEAVIETMKASLHVKKEQPEGDGIAMYAVEISPVSFQMADLPMSYGGETEWKLKPLPFVSEEIPDRKSTRLNSSHVKI